MFEPPTSQNQSRHRRSALDMSTTSDERRAPHVPEQKKRTRLTTAKVWLMPAKGTPGEPSNYTRKLELPMPGARAAPDGIANPFD